MANNYNQSFDVAGLAPGSDPMRYDDDGRPKRTGTVWTASAHIITAVIGAGVLSLAWAMAQLGWIAGVVCMLLFAIVTYCSSYLLSECYRTGDSESGKRNYRYMDAVQSILGGSKFKACGIIQYSTLFGISVGYTIASAISMMAVKRSNCYHESQGQNPCEMNGNPYMIAFGVSQLFLSQIPDFDQLWWLSVVAALMSFTYAGIGLGLGIAQVAENQEFKGSMTGVTVGPSINSSKKIWNTLQALGDIAFAYSYALILIEIQDTVRSPPSEAKTMKKSALLSIAVTTCFFLLCGGFGYAAFGDSSPGNLLTGFGFYNPYWLLDLANVAVVIHLVGAYQVFAQPIFAFIEKKATQRWPESDFINKDIKVPLPGMRPYNLNLFKLVWRSIFVVLTTIISMLLPFFNDVVAFLGALAFWPLAIYFPVGMYIKQKNIPKWSTTWTCLHMLSVACFFVSAASGVASIVGIFNAVKKFQPFHADY